MTRSNAFKAGAQRVSQPPAPRAEPLPVMYGLYASARRSPRPIVRFRTPRRRSNSLSPRRRRVLEIDSRLTHFYARLGWRHAKGNNRQSARDGNEAAGGRCRPSGYPECWARKDRDTHPSEHDRPARKASNCWLALMPSVQPRHRLSNQRPLSNVSHRRMDISACRAHGGFIAGSGSTRGAGG